MKVWQVKFPDDKVQVSADGVSERDARQVIIDFMTEFITNEIEKVEVPEQADVSQLAEESGREPE